MQNFLKKISNVNFYLFVDIFRRIEINRLFLTCLGNFEMGYMCLFLYVSKCLQNYV